MTLTPANPIAIEHETFGESTAPPVLLIMGLGGQLIHWDEALCRRLAGLGRYMIRFDNRDVWALDEARRALFCPGYAPVCPRTA